MDKRAATGMPTIIAWQNADGARLCLEKAYGALTERDLSDVETLIAEVAPLGPAGDLLAEDDYRCAKLRFVQLVKSLAVYHVRKPNQQLLAKCRRFVRPVSE